MPKYKLILSITVFCILMTGCVMSDVPGYVDPGGTKTAQANVTPAPKEFIQQSTRTPMITATPSLDYGSLLTHANETSVSSLSTVDAANIIVAGITAQFNSEQAAIEISKNEADKAAANAQSISIGQTASLAPTAIHLTGTAFVAANTLVSAKITDAVQQPTNNWALAESFNADATIRSNNAVKSAGAAFIMVCTVFLVMKLIALLRYTPNPSAPAEKQETKEVSFEKLDEAGDTLVRIHPDIPCPQHILLQFADGICNDKKTLVFRDWLDTPVYKYMKDLRDFMHINRMSQRARGGEFDIVDRGNEFLEFTRANNCPPPPYRCVL